MTDHDRREVDTSSDQYNRRTEDRDRMLNTRLDTMERNYQSLDHKITALESQLTVVKLEQTHLKELFEARLRVIEESQKVQLAETKAIGVSIHQMGERAENTPGGRLLMAELGSVRAQCDQNADSLDERKKAHDELNAWRNQIDGVLTIMKWVGAGGLVALGLSLLRLVKAIP